MPRIAVLLLALTWFGHAAPAPAQTMFTGNPYYLPLIPGNEAWYADARTGAPAFRITVGGSPGGAAVLTQTPWGTAAPVWRALVAGEPDGDVFVLAEAAGDEPFVPFAVPLPILDAPLEPGRSWSVGWEWCAPEGYWGPEYSWSVDAVEDVVVPAGRFHCQRVRFRTLCQVVPADMYWYADGVGLVKAAFISRGFGPGGPETYELMATPVATEAVTWGRLQSLYR